MLRRWLAQSARIWQSSRTNHAKIRVLRYRALDRAYDTLRRVICSAVTHSAASLSKWMLLCGMGMSFCFAKRILLCELTWRRTQTVPFEGRVPLSTVVLCSKTRQVQRSTKLKTAQDRLAIRWTESAFSRKRYPRGCTRDQHDSHLVLYVLASRHIPRSLYPVVHSRGYINCLASVFNYNFRD